MCHIDLGFYSVRLAFATFGYELPEFASAQILVELNGVPLDLDCLLLWEQEKSGDGLPFLRSSNFRCSYFELSRQDAVISSSKTAVSMDDFVIPLVSIEYCNISRMYPTSLCRVQNRVLLTGPIK